MRYQMLEKTKVIKLLDLKLTHLRILKVVAGTKIKMRILRKKDMIREST